MRKMSRRQREKDTLYGSPADYYKALPLPPFEIHQVNGGLDVDVNNPVLSVADARDLIQALTQAVAAAELLLVLDGDNVIK